MEVSGIEGASLLQLSSAGDDRLSGTGLRTIVIVDRSVMRRECLALMLKSEVAEFHFISVNKVDEMPRTRVDGVLLSVGTSVDDVAQALAGMETIRAALDDCPVVAIADSEQSEVAIELLRAGFRGYISTSFEVGLALAAIRLVCSGGTFVPPCAVKFLGGPAAAISLPAQRANGRDLTVREEQILQHLRSGKPNKTIAHSLGISESTVKVHLQHIMRKMNATNRTEVASRIQDYVE